VTLSVLLAPAPAARASTISCEIHYLVGAQWPASSQAPGGFSGGLIIKNTGTTTIDSWAVHFTFPNGQVIFSAFGATLTQLPGGDITFNNLFFNGTINPGSTAIYEPGFNANWFGVNNPPTSISLNGTACTLVIGR